MMNGKPDESQFGELLERIVARFPPTPPRDPARIPRVLAELHAVWALHPDLRLGQLIQNLGDVYYVEDADLLARLRRLYDPTEDPNQDGA